VTAGAVLLMLGAGVTFAAGVGYARDTLRGRVQPNRVTWFVSGVSAWIACAGQVTQGVLLGAVLTLAVAVVPTLIVAASFANRDAYWRTTRLDVVCPTHVLWINAAAEQGGDPQVEGLRLPALRSSSC
jgi:hypothetical protein